MRRKTLWIWITCLVLLLICLSVCLWLGNRDNGETAQTQISPTQEMRQESDPGNNGTDIDHNGDTLLPEAP